MSSTSPCTVTFYKRIHLSRRLYIILNGIPDLPFRIFFRLNPHEREPSKMQYLSLNRYILHNTLPKNQSIVVKFPTVHVCFIKLLEVLLKLIVSALFSLNNFPSLFPREMLVRQFLRAR